MPTRSRESFDSVSSSATAQLAPNLGLEVEVRFKAVFVCSAPFDPLWTNSLPLRAWERTIALLEAGSPYIKHFLFSSFQNQ